MKSSVTRLRMKLGFSVLIEMPINVAARPWGVMLAAALAQFIQDFMRLLHILQIWSLHLLADSVFATVFTDRLEV